MSPRVSFIVPCYRLAHLLPECIDSILMQTYADLEVIIMDDCSPDNTEEIAHSYDDPRVKYIRNEQNLGHLSNYNKGIALSAGKYVWLISADDRLRFPYVLERYVQLLEAHPDVGYVFCPAMGVFDGRETRVINTHGCKDAVFDGIDFLTRLLDANTVVAPCAIARKECYEELSYFPLDMPWAGDWYLWCVFALRYRVGYFAEPMVNYRTHDLSMTNTLMARDPRICINDDMLVWHRTLERAREAKEKRIVKRCRHLMAYTYAMSVLSPRYGNRVLTVAESYDSAARIVGNRRDLRLLWARFCACIGDQESWKHQFRSAFQWYSKGLYRDPLMLTVWLKLLSLVLAKKGLQVRQKVRTLGKLSWSNL